MSQQVTAFTFVVVEEHAYKTDVDAEDQLLGYKPPRALLTYSIQTTTWPPSSPMWHARHACLTD